MNPDSFADVAEYQRRCREGILADIRSAFMQHHEVRPARSGRVNLHLLDRRDRDRAMYDPRQPLRDGMDHDELWESVETGEVVGLTCLPYFNTSNEAGARAEWEERLRYLTTDYGLVVIVRPSVYGWHLVGETLLIEIWYPGFHGFPVTPSSPRRAR